MSVNCLNSFHDSCLQMLRFLKIKIGLPGVEWIKKASLSTSTFGKQIMYAPDLGKYFLTSQEYKLTFRNSVAQKMVR